MRKNTLAVAQITATSSNTNPTPTTQELNPKKQQQQHDDFTTAATSSASLITSSIFSLTNRVRAMVVPESRPAPPPPPPSSIDIEMSSASESEADSEYNLPENTFELILSGRSPPFVFDLHADGSSIVVVKLVGDRRSMDPRLQEGCVVRYINDVEVRCTSRQEFDQVLSSTEETPLRLILEHSPALYRHQDALSLFTSGASEQPIHVFTVMPNPHYPPQSPGPIPSGAKKNPTVTYDDVYRTAHRATQVLQAFRAQGVSVTLISMETVLVGANSAYAGDLVASSAGGGGGGIGGAIAGQFSSSPSPLLRAIRVWFKFPEALELVVSNPGHHIGALEVSRGGEEGSWIVIRCIASQSPWVEEGMVLGRPYLVTHVNGLDTSASGYRSINPRVRGAGTFESSLLPLFHEEKIALTIV